MRQYMLAFYKDGEWYGRSVEAFSLLEAQWMAHRLGWVCHGEVRSRVTLPSVTPGWMVPLLQSIIRAWRRWIAWATRRVPMDHFETVKGFE